MEQLSHKGMTELWSADLREAEAQTPPSAERIAGIALAFTAITIGLVTIAFGILTTI